MTLDSSVRDCIDCIKTAGRALAAMIHTPMKFLNALPCVDGKLCSEIHINFVLFESVNKQMKALGPPRLSFAEACARI